MFGRRLEKREKLLGVRLTDDEKSAVEWCAEQMRRRDGVNYTPSDVAREALARLYAELQEATTRPTRTQKKR